MASLQSNDVHCAVWRADVEYESKLVTTLPMTSVVEQLKPLLAEGWRPRQFSQHVAPTCPQVGNIANSLCHTVSTQAVRRFWTFSLSVDRTRLIERGVGTVELRAGDGVSWDGHGDITGRVGKSSRC